VEAATCFDEVIPADICWEEVIEEDICFDWLNDVIDDAWLTVDDVIEDAWLIVDDVMEEAWLVCDDWPTFEKAKLLPLLSDLNSPDTRFLMAASSPMGMTFTAPGRSFPLTVGARGPGASILELVYFL